MKGIFILIFLLLGLRETYATNSVMTNKWLDQKVEVQSDMEQDDSIEEYVIDDPEFMNKLQQVTTHDMENAKQVMEKGWKDSTLLSLAELPEEDIYMYGYNAEDDFRGVLIKMGDEIHCFDWYYYSPRLINPTINYEDYDDDGRKELAVSLYLGSGTGVSIEYLYVLEHPADGVLEAYPLYSEEYLNAISNRITYKIDEKNKTIALCDGKRILQQVDISWADGMKIDDIYYGDIVSFDIEKTLILNIQPGFVVSEWATPRYDGLRPLNITIKYSDGKFELGEIK